MRQESLRFICPEVGVDRVGRIHELIDRWIRSEPLADLVKEFDGSVPSNAPYEDLVAWLLQFSERWDYRRLQQQAAAKDVGESARWLVNAADIPSDQRARILHAARALGLTGSDTPVGRGYDYLLVLGGARLSCLLRPRLAAHLVEQAELRPKVVAFLGSARPIAQSERDATDTYALGANTEYELINRGGEIAFGMSAAKFSEERSEDATNQNRSWAIRRYETGRPYELVSVSAPSSEPDKRRANSVDTYEFFLSQFQVQPGGSLLLVTSEIYVPYQQLEALRTVAIPHEVVIDTVGFPAEWGGALQGMVEPTNYLQEVRSTIQSADRFIKALPRGVR